MNKYFSSRRLKVLWLFLGLFLLCGLAFLGGRQQSKAKKATPSPSLAAALVKKEIGRELSLELKNIKNKEKTKLTYSIESAELTEEILVKGERLRALSHKAFLIFNLKIVNSGQQGIQINSRDFVRLSLAGKEEWLAPEIHNDPVTVQAISTKYTRLAFPVNRTEKQFKVRLGEISAEKIEFDLNL